MESDSSGCLALSFFRLGFDCVIPTLCQVVEWLPNDPDKAFFGPRLSAFMAEAEKALGKHKWFAGEELTAADIVMGYSMELAAHRAGMDAGNYPNAHRFLQQMRAYPSYQRALEKDGKGTILL